MFQGEGIQRNNGMAGFDWAIHKGNNQAANSDLGIPIFVNQEQFILRDRFDLVEGLSGWVHDDTLIGRAFVTGAIGEAGGVVRPSPGRMHRLPPTRTRSWNRAWPGLRACASWSAIWIGMKAIRMPLSWTPAMPRTSCWAAPATTRSRARPATTSSMAMPG
ncbi:hypothetical protein [Siccirubricoccus sp. G192]|uniref:hypothetical protein n=1 Tax=Siccirubricoccus sp. G192 TaxID=2849651 RepID=UPI001C2C5A25|nr:hypothetical protein [Siccirubricoccus sp. G192]MBV1796393.1 hypothetical protein [Siccirubricoccus sp. G192]